MFHLRSRPVIVSCGCALLCVAFIFAGRQEGKVPSAQLRFNADLYKDVPLSERIHTRGASAPSWSPDSRSIVFSLYGSLWRMPAGGGEATQLTSTTPGYDGGGSWSPDGLRVAFIRGERPILGAQIGVLGKLMVLDLASSRETILAPGRQFVGTPVWSGASLIASDQQGAEVNLYRVPLDGSAPERLTGMLTSRVPTITPRGSAWYYYWFAAAIHPDGRDIAFASDRDGAAQLWSMPLHPGLVISRKLTRHRERDQADIQDLSWQDGNTLLYSANLHSDRTNFDLWRWRNGSPGTVERLTSTIQDEFSPRVSPDGKTLLFVSNYLGDLDLFTARPDLTSVRHLRIESLKFTRPSGRLKIHVRDSEGRRLAARISVRAADRKYYVPAGAMSRHHAGMGERAGFFHTAEDSLLDVPSGEVTVTAFHGLEHEPAELRVTVPPGGETVAEVRLRRVLEWQGNGWWSGEDHIHANYAGPYYLRPEDALTMAEAEDLNVSNMLAANAEGERAYDREFFEGKVNALSKPGHILQWNEEYRNRIVYGHMALLNLRRLTEPMFTSFEGTSSPYDYPSNTMIAERARADGAIVDYVHPMVGNSRDPFDSTVSAKELPVTAALGHVDVMDIYPFGPIALDIWYKLLNCGFRIAPGAGTDTFANWRSINQLPGNFRVMARGSGRLTYGDWIRSLREGRTFVTNGPMLRVTVNGQEPGAVVKSASGQGLDLALLAEGESLTPIDKVEVILNGRVAATFDAGKARRFRYEWKHKAARSGWVAVRVSGEASPRSLGAAGQAHSAPIYLEAGGRPMPPGREDARFFVRWMDRLEDLIETRNNFAKPADKENVRKLITRAREFYSRAAGSN